MNRTPELFEYKELQLEYLKYGDGEELILAFHGFGESMDNFRALNDLIRADQCLVSCHLFQHGASRFPENRLPNKPLSIDEFRALILAFLKHLGAQECHLIGYSLGAKICLCLFLAMTDRVNNVLLLAPDGFKVNLLYSFTSRTKFGRWIYKQVLYHPRWFFKLTDLLFKLKIIDKKLHRFVFYHMESFEQRKLVYDTWLIYRDFIPNKQSLSEKLQGRKHQFSAIFGKYDRIIQTKVGKEFFRGELKKHYHEVESGHLLLNQGTKEYIARKDLWPEDRK